MMIPFPIINGFLMCIIPIFIDNIDPTYFWFRHAQRIFPPTYILALRILLLFIITMHGSMIIFPCIIYATNVILSLDTNLRKMARHTFVGT